MFNCVGSNEARRYVEAYRNYILNHDLDIDPVPEGPAVPADITVWLTDEARARIELGEPVRDPISTMMESVLQYRQALQSNGFYARVIRDVGWVGSEPLPEAVVVDNVVDDRLSGDTGFIPDTLRATCSLKDLFENKCEVENGQLPR